MSFLFQKLDTFYWTFRSIKNEKHVVFWTRARPVTPLARLVGSSGNKAFIPTWTKRKEKKKGQRGTNTMRGKEGEKKIADRQTSKEI